MEKTKIAKALGAGAGTIILLSLLNEVRVEINDLRERIVRVETIIIQGDKE